MNARTKKKKIKLSFDEFIQNQLHLVRLHELDVDKPIVITIDPKNQSEGSILFIGSHLKKLLKKYGAKKFIILPTDQTSIGYLTDEQYNSIYKKIIERNKGNDRN